MLPSEAEVRKHGEELNKVWQSLSRAGAPRRVRRLAARA